MGAAITTSRRMRRATKGAEMETHYAYCSACDRQVEVVVRKGTGIDPGTGEPADEIVCLAFGESCTGAMCPLCALPLEQLPESPGIDHFDTDRDEA
jgi:hypothetical protein